MYIVYVFIKHACSWSTWLIRVQQRAKGMAGATQDRIYTAPNATYWNLTEPVLANVTPRDASQHAAPRHVDFPDDTHLSMQLLT